MVSRCTPRFVLLAVAFAAAFGCDRIASCSGGPKSEADQAAALDKAAASAQALPQASCAKCRELMCAKGSNDEDVDLAAGCLQKPDPRFAPNPDASFASDCRAVVECAFKHNCAYDPALGPSHCYCGSKLLDECLREGPADDAPCVAEWQAATRSKNNGEILERFSDSAYPAGWAFNLLECDRDRCGAKSSVGRCVP